MTHAELVDRAGRWLRSQRYTTVVTEKFAVGYEEPDAIGFRGSGWSMLVECKASRADFARDAEKPFRKIPVLGMGYWRVFMAPAGLIAPTELPDQWGLVEVSGRAARLVVKPADFIERNIHAELCLLLAYTRRREGVSRRMRKPVEASL